MRHLRWDQPPVIVDDGIVQRASCSKCKSKVVRVNAAGLCADCAKEEIDAND